MARRRFLLECARQPGLALLAGAIFLTFSGAVSAGGDCVSAVTPWPVVMPDGTTVAAGTLTVCRERDLNPVRGLHELRASGHALGLYVSATGEAERFHGDTPVLVFRRLAAGRFELVGYGRPDGDRFETFSFLASGRTRPAVDPAAIAGPADGTLVHLAASLGRPVARSG